MSLHPDELAQLNTLIYQPEFQEACNQAFRKARGKRISLGDVIASMPADGGDEWTTPDGYDALRQAVSSDSRLSDLTVCDFTSPGVPVEGRTTQTSHCMALTDGDGTLYVVYRGTDGEHGEWRDDFEGLNEADTDSQRRAEAYLDEMLALYGGQHVVVTGHSKGGNKAQYVTVVDGRVDECYSFDGQGFGNPFLRKYEERIAAVRGRIHAYNQEGDYVSALMAPIAGDTHYTNGGSQAQGITGLLQTLLRGDGNFQLSNHAPLNLFSSDTDLSLDLTGTRTDYSRTINDFTTWVSENVPADMQALVIEFLSDCAEGRQSEALSDPEKVAALMAVLTKYPGTQRLLEQLAGTDGANDGALASSGVGTGVNAAAAVLVRLGCDSGVVATIVSASNYAGRGAVASPVGATGGGGERARAYASAYATDCARIDAHVAAGEQATTVQVRQSLVRDWSDEYKEKLLSIVQQVDEEEVWDPTHWDVWYRIESLGGGLTAENCQGDIDGYLRKQIDMNGVSAQRIEEAFQKATELDGTMGTNASAVAESLDGVTEALGQILGGGAQ